jgi:hypothetical protein
MGKLEELIQEANDAGWWVNNLFQTTEGWQANLRSDTHATQFGRGPTAEYAMQEALFMIAEAMPLQRIEVNWTTQPSVREVLQRTLGPVCKIGRRGL